MKNETDKHNYSRRAFLEAGIVGGVGVALGLTAGKILTDKDTDTVKLLTASGEVVEVDRRFLPPATGKRISNKDLEAWMEEEKH